MSDQNTEKDKGATFDMYHFFSRKDVILAAAVIVGLLLYVLFRFFTGAHAV